MLGECQLCISMDYSLMVCFSEVVQPDASSTLCLSYFAVNTYIGILTMFFAECIFVVRAYVVWEKRITGIIIISITAFMIPIVIFFQDMISSVSGECWIPGLFSHSRRVGYLFGNSYQVVLQSILVIRMHRDFWKSDRVSSDIYGQISLTTFTARTPDLV
ncbi:hypothetical protein AZE42_12692 [Rhizopogon vesiculosus]|uniref:Uncharacterized protein n=1 Tax=Rhizopogon vesiculosus TaxID=180088 RepID=A0A1J8QJZ7_9AGAM|nr:hypothetical protein AZE42_12692 [Rhizopogon vesiculosus]